MKCADCKEECSVIWEDQGIGPYEYWGAKYCDSHFVAVTDCCGCDKVLNDEGDEEDATEYAETYDDEDRPRFSLGRQRGRPRFIQPRTN